MRQNWKDVLNYVVNVNLISRDDDVMMGLSVTWLFFSKTEELFPELWFGDVTFGSNNCKLISVGSLVLNVSTNNLMTNNHLQCFIDCRQKTYFWCCIQDQTFKCSYGPNPYLALGAAAYLALGYFRDWLFWKFKTYIEHQLSQSPFLCISRLISLMNFYLWASFRLLPNWDVEERERA